jgi:hypothetical protein
MGIYILDVATFQGVTANTAVERSLERDLLENFFRLAGFKERS